MEGPPGNYMRIMFTLTSRADSVVRVRVLTSGCWAKLPPARRLAISQHRIKIPPAHPVGRNSPTRQKLLQLTHGRGSPSYVLEPER